ncbi:hypothetical protein [Roseivirga sp.]|uniref:hypothetical protein n=1 Tax=Roseivirga sp. TaxID=1964215 RepID=UPI003B52DB66
MKKLLFFLPAFLLLACGEDINPGESNRFFYAHSELTAPESNSGTYVEWTEGNKIIFRYALVHPDSKEIADDELTEIFWIEIPSDVNSFSVNLEADSDIETYYTRMCFCGFEAFEFTQLEASGKKLSNGTWEVSFKMKAKTASYHEEYSLEDSGIYFPGQRNNP